MITSFNSKLAKMILDTSFKDSATDTAPTQESPEDTGTGRRKQKRDLREVLNIKNLKGG